MWNSHESVYDIIKPPVAFKPRTPPPTAKEVVCFPVVSTTSP